MNLGKFPLKQCVTAVNWRPNRPWPAMPAAGGAGGAGARVQGEARGKGRFGESGDGDKREL